jgi:hypothetical protein
MGQSIEKDFVETRRDICKTCDSQKFYFNVRTCSECLCPIWTKTQVKSTECPLGKWGPEN